jgi:protein gp37
MGESTNIEWTEATFNPWWGCTKVSPACDGCYAERDAKRFGFPELWGAGVPRRFFGAEHWEKPRKWNAKAAAAGRRLKVFCASMADVFDNEVADEHRERLWQLIRETPAIDWQIVTKRIGNARKMLPADWGNGYSNVWLLSTVVNQEEVDRDVPKLLATPARRRGLSIEPMLGPIDLTRLDVGLGFGANCLAWPSMSGPGRGIGRLDWIIVGGESGPGARPLHPDWVRTIRDQCQRAGVAFFFKQWGEWAETKPVAGGDLGGDMRRGLVRFVEADREPDGHFRKGDVIMRRVGRKEAGRALDGATYSEFPSSPALDRRRGYPDELPSDLEPAS